MAAGNDESEDIEFIKAEIEKFPAKEFYPGLFEDLRQVKAELAARAAGRNRARLGHFARERQDQSLKAYLIQQWRRRQRRLTGINDNWAPPQS